eukprot:Rmarinus@m.24459
MGDPCHDNIRSVACLGENSAVVGLVFLGIIFVSIVIERLLHAIEHALVCPQLRLLYLRITKELMILGVIALIVYVMGESGLLREMATLDGSMSEHDLKEFHEFIHYAVFFAAMCHLCVVAFLMVIGTNLPRYLWGDVERRVRREKSSHTATTPTPHLPSEAIYTTGESENFDEDTIFGEYLRLNLQIWSSGSFLSRLNVRLQLKKWLALHAVALRIGSILQAHRYTNRALMELEFGALGPWLRQQVAHGGHRSDAQQGETEMSYFLYLCMSTRRFLLHMTELDWPIVTPIIIFACALVVRGLVEEDEEAPPTDVTVATFFCVGVLLLILAIVLLVKTDNILNLYVKVYTGKTSHRTMEHLLNDQISMSELDEVVRMVQSQGVEPPVEAGLPAANLAYIIPPPQLRTRAMSSPYPHPKPMDYSPQNPSSLPEHSILHSHVADPAHCRAAAAESLPSHQSDAVSMREPLLGSTSRRHESAEYALSAEGSCHDQESGVRHNESPEHSSAIPSGKYSRRQFLTRSGLVFWRESPERLFRLIQVVILYQALYVTLLILTFGPDARAEWNIVATLLLCAPPLLVLVFVPVLLANAVLIFDQVGFGHSQQIQH